MKKIESVTCVAGVARSGTSWLGQIFDSVETVRYRFQPFFSYEFKHRVNEDSSVADFRRLLEEMHDIESAFLNQSDKRLSGEYPIFQKSNYTPNLVFKEVRYLNIIEPMMRKCPEIKLVAIIRNPCAVLNSWMNAPKEFPPGSIPLKEWRYGDCKNSGHEDFFGYYKWKEATNLYLDLHAKWKDRVYLLRYENLVETPQNIVRDLFQFCSLQYNEQTDKFIKASSNSHQDSPYSVFKKKNVSSRWTEKLDPYIIKEIVEDLSGTRLEQFILE